MPDDIGMLIFIYHFILSERYLLKGGFEGKPDPALYKRWFAFGALSSHSRLHGSGSYRVSARLYIRRLHSID